MVRMSIASLILAIIALAIVLAAIVLLVVFGKGDGKEIAIAISSYLGGIITAIIALSRNTTP